MARDTARDVRIEAVPGKQCVGTLTTRPRIHDSGQERPASLDQPHCRLLVGGAAGVGRIARCQAGLIERGHASCLEGGGGDVPRHTPKPEFLAEGPLPPGTNAIAGLQPATRVRVIVEEADLNEPFCGSVDQGLRIPRAEQPFAKVLDRASARFQQPHGGRQNCSPVRLGSVKRESLRARLRRAPTRTLCGPIPP